MKRRQVLQLLALTLTGCATVSPVSLPARQTLVRFAIDARFAWRETRPDGSSHSAGGRLEWLHREQEDRILIANPLGIGLAEIEHSPTGSRLRTGDGREFSAADPETLLLDATGQTLPIRRLPDWLLGRPAAGGQLQTDAQARPIRLDEAGWRIDYLYEQTDADALPAQLIAQRADGATLRLRIEAWRSLP